MLERTVSNMLEANAKTLVNAVYCVDMTSTGAALQGKQAYQNTCRAYKQHAAVRSNWIGC